MIQRRFALSCAAGLLLASGLVACQNQTPATPTPGPSSPTAPRAQSVQVQPAQRGNLQTSISYTGDIRAKTSVSVIPRVSARIEEIRVDISETVKQGDVIAVLDSASLRASLRSAQGSLQSAQARLQALQSPRDEDIAIARANVVAAQDRLDKLVNPPATELETLRVAVANAEATLKQAQSNYDRVAFEPDVGRRPEAVALEQATNNYNAAVANLRNRTNPPQQDVDVQRQAVEQAEQQLKKALQPATEADLANARGAVTSAQAQVEAAQINVNEATIKAPISGIISDRPQPVGSTTSTQTPIVTILSQEVEAVIPIEETRLQEVQVGTRAIINVAAYPGEDIPGAVISVSPTVDQRSRTFTVRVEPADQSGKLKPGMFAQIRLITVDKQGVVIVPKDAVVTRGTQKVVFVFDNGTARMTPVQTGAADDNNIEITSGVDAGAQIIVSGLANLRDGDTVTRAAGGGGAPGGGGQRPSGTPSAGGTPGAGGTRPAGTPSAGGTPGAQRTGTPAAGG